MLTEAGKEGAWQTFQDNVSRMLFECGGLDLIVHEFDLGELLAKIVDNDYRFRCREREEDHVLGRRFSHD
jgi:hypothetical protein